MANQIKKSNPAFIKYLEERSFNVLLFREELENILKAQSEPLTIVEIIELAYQKTGRMVDKMTMHAHIKELLKDGAIISRTETRKERSLRAKNKVTSGMLATLYFAPRLGITEVPERTIAEAVPGVVLSSVEDRRYKKPKAKKRGRPLGSKNKIKPEVSTGGIHDLVAQILSAHQASTLMELEETKGKLELVQRTLAELLKKIS